MALLSAESISKAFTERRLFDGVTLGLQPGEKVALVGANGAGKTTLLRILAGLAEPDGGRVARRNGLRLAYLEQQPVLEPGKTVEDILFDESNELSATVSAYERAMAHPESIPADVLEKLLIRMDELQAWDYDARRRQVLARLGITDLEARTEALSGGQRKRVALARLLLSEPELVLMDEPTNHLDLEAIEWLENYLRSARMALLMITHDRYFLDNVSQAVLELDGGKIYRYDGNYAYFLEKKAERQASDAAAHERARNLYARELEWMRRQPRARSTKAKYRVDAFEEVKEAAQRPGARQQIDLQVQARRQGGKVLEISHLQKSYGDKTMVADFSYVFRKQDRIGLIGRNGVGKSTFLDLITGREPADKGEIDWGQTTRPGYYTQHTDDIAPGRRIIDEVKDIAEYVELADGRQVSASKLLDMFLFPPTQQYSLTDKLSGGERRRLQLLKVLVANPNFLILDEPTNDLDIDTLNVLEQFLAEFAGCLVLVSHDRYFMDRLVEHLFIFEGDGQIRDYPGNYSAYRDELDEAEDAAKAALKNPAKAPASQPVAIVSTPPTPTAPAKKRSFKEDQELRHLEDQVAKLEARKGELEAELSSASDYARITEASRDIAKIDRDLEAALERMIELEG